MHRSIRIPCTEADIATLPISANKCQGYKVRVIVRVRVRVRGKGKGKGKGIRVRVRVYG
jgi:hypothetical protein